ncbi:MAG: hypothetical protein OXJ52_01840 [Oligoflexia bacterium]|nr:hypothetical protein [Oligoflexia bacterium]
MSSDLNTMRPLDALWQTACLKFALFICKILNDKTSFIANIISLKTHNYK